MEILKLENNSEYWSKTINYTRACSYSPGKHLAWLLENDKLKDWESVFIIADRGNVYGYCTIQKEDYYPENRYSPWISTIFVDEKIRGRRFSGQLIEAAERHAVACGFDTVYIPTDIVGFYEKYGYEPIDKLLNYNGDLDSVYMKKLQK